MAVGAVAEVAAAGAADDAALLAALVLGLQLAGVAVAGGFWKGNGRRSSQFLYLRRFMTSFRGCNLHLFIEQQE